MDPNLVVNLALTALNEVLSIIAHIRAQGGMTTEQIAALADQQDLAIKTQSRLFSRFRSWRRFMAGKGERGVSREVDQRPLLH